MRFIKEMQRNIYNPDFYMKEVSKETFGEAFLYLLKYVAFLAGVLSLFLISALAIFFFGGKYSEMVSELTLLYPENLEITLSNGEVSTNVEEPYIIPFSEDIYSAEGDDFENFIVIDTKSPVTFESAQEYKTVALVGKNTFGIQNENGGFEIHTVPRDIQEALSRPWIDEKVQMISGIVRGWGFLIIALCIPIFLFPSLVVGIMIYLVFAALFVWVVARVKGLSYGYKRSYIASMHLITLPQALSMAMPWVFFSIPLFRTILIVVLAVLNLKKIYPPEEEPLQEETNLEEKIQDAQIEDVVPGKA